MTQLPIQFLLQQLANNEQDRERFNSISTNLKFMGELKKVHIDDIKDCYYDDKEKKQLNFKANFYFIGKQEKSSSPIYFSGLFFWPRLLEELVRICLSRVNGEAVLEILDDMSETGAVKWGLLEKDGNALTAQANGTWGHVSTILYLAFDEPLRNGQSLEEAIEALHTKMLELAPEYVTFCEEKTKKEIPTANCDLGDRVITRDDIYTKGSWLDQQNKN